jgi:hypothetical protein
MLIICLVASSAYSGKIARHHFADENIERAPRRITTPKQIDQATRHIDATDARFAEAPLHRTRGKLLITVEALKLVSEGTLQLLIASARRSALLTFGWRKEAEDSRKKGPASHARRRREVMAGRTDRQTTGSLRC